MRRRSVLGTVAAALLGRSARAASPAGLTGRWSGALQAGPQRLRLRFEVAEDGTAVLRSLDQGGAPIPAQVAGAAGGRVRIDVPAVGGVFEGELKGDALPGVWRQGGGALPLALARGDGFDHAPATSPAPLTQARLEALRAQAGAPALGAGAARRGAPPRLWTAGERRAGSGAPVTENDPWHLGSITKSMTATLTGRLVDAGRLRWDDTPGALLAEAAPDMRPEYREVTLLHLLSHRSGLAANLPMAQFATFPRQSADARADRIRYARAALAAAPTGPAGSRFEYSNSGYVVAAAMLERRLGEPWEALIMRELFGPLGLASAGFGAPGQPGALDAPVGHGPGPQGPLTPYGPEDAVNDNPAVLGPAGRVHMSLPDLLTYLAAHRDRTDLLKPETWKVLHTPPFGGGYALGWEVGDEGELRHNGSNTLWYAEALVRPASGVVAAAAVNLAAAGAAAVQAVGEAAAAV